MSKPAAETRARLDKWLWAARFFKTRRIAKQAIDGGKVHCDGQRVKAAKEITVGATLKIRQGLDEKTVLVTMLSSQRRGAADAALLYEETAASKALRDKRVADYKAGARGFIASDHKPDKKERRQIQKFRRANLQPDE